MKEKTELLDGLCADEAVCFIAGRHHVTPQLLLRHFLFGETCAEGLATLKANIPLEPNEIEILKGLYLAAKN